MTPRIITAAERAARRQGAATTLKQVATPPAKGLGDRLQTVIHAGLDALPMSVTTRTIIKGCSGCAKRKNFLNNAGEFIKRLFFKES